jgi:hypothetical protein
MDVLLLTCGPVIFSDPGVKCVFIHPQVTGRLRNLVDPIRPRVSPHAP